MKTFYSILSAMVAVVLFAPLAGADPGTTWGNKLDDDERFRVLVRFNREAVLDRETGRVWEQSPDTDERTWFASLFHCYNRNVDDRKGWRLPTIEELASLVDPTQSNPALPAGHPFRDVESSNYWSATTQTFNTSNAWFVLLGNGNVFVEGKSNLNLVWCVRGGQGIDGL
ncbi:MAG: DUF1566 domain-containing protein [Gammaproteobacteria bacterium]